jgi:hypothetical protein
MSDKRLLAKVQIKSEITAPFGGIFYAKELFCTSKDVESIEL